MSQEEVKGSTIKKCPYCAEEILSTAIKCKHCQSDLGDLKTAKPSNAKNSSTNLNTCPSCGSKNIRIKRAYVGIFILIALVTFGLALLFIPFLPQYGWCYACKAYWKV